MKRSTAVILLIMTIVILDQWLKIYIKTTMSLGGEFNILGLNWARIHFVENDGMAFGLSFGGEIGKILLSVFRVAMLFFLFYFVWGLIRAKESFGLILSIGAIIAGAMGNIIDSLFYGIIFSKSRYHGKVAELFPAEGGYGSFLQGEVVDMFYFPMVNSFYPAWFPFWAGERLLFFKPVFNIADAAISVGVFMILVFYRQFFKSEPKTKKTFDGVEE